MSAIICTDLCKYYQQGDAIIKGLDHVSLEIAEGSFICLSGPSGSGKFSSARLSGSSGIGKANDGLVGEPYHSCPAVPRVVGGPPVESPRRLLRV